MKNGYCYCIDDNRLDLSLPISPHIVLFIAFILFGLFSSTLITCGAGCDTLRALNSV